jgi:hypothetical protein
MAKIQARRRKLLGHLGTVADRAAQQSPRLLGLVAIGRGEPAFEYMAVVALKIKYF